MQRVSTSLWFSMVVWNNKVYIYTHQYQYDAIRITQYKFKAVAWRYVVINHIVRLELIMIPSIIVECEVAFLISLMIYDIGAVTDVLSAKNSTVYEWYKENTAIPKLG